MIYLRVNSDIITEEMARTISHLLNNIVFKLSINITKSFWIVYVVLMVLANKINADNVKRFFFAPIWLYSNKIYFSAVSIIYFIITLFKTLLKIFFKAIGQ